MVEAKYEAARTFVTDHRELLAVAVPLSELRDIVHAYYFSQLDFETAIYNITYDDKLLGPVVNLLLTDDMPFIQDWCKQVLEHFSIHDNRNGWPPIEQLRYCLKWPHLHADTSFARIWCFYSGSCQCGHPLTVSNFAY